MAVRQVLGPPPCPPRGDQLQRVVTGAEVVEDARRAHPGIPGQRAQGRREITTPHHQAEHGDQYGIEHVHDHDVSRHAPSPPRMTSAR
jgi:hypothetical protein